MRIKVAARILALRLDSGKTKVHIAKMLGYDRGYLTKLETGKSIPDLQVLARLAVYYEVPVEWFITGRGLTRNLKDPMHEFRSGHAPLRTKISAPRRSRMAQAH